MKVTKEMTRFVGEQFGDKNSIHFNNDAIAHGVSIFALISSEIWKKFGDGTKVVKAACEFKRAILVGQEFRLEIGERQPERTEYGLWKVLVTAYVCVGGRDKVAATVDLVISIP